jgi:hypothetical protein
MGEWSGVLVVLGSGEMVICGWVMMGMWVGWNLVWFSAKVASLGISGFLV